jgi:AraC family transcriptional regulator of adaptative response/methylated-DNA-[protein]-cysteine methyltransferase
MTSHPTPNDAKDGGARWQAVLDRDRRRDGAFVYAVVSTGIFCRPSCPSKRPRVRFYALAEAAVAAGFRPCKRCRPQVLASPDPKLDLVRRVCREIDAAEDKVPSLARLAAATGHGASHLQRTFSQVMGISPRAYFEARRLARVKAALAGGEAVAPALYGAGYGSSSRLYEKAPAHFGMTPASYAKGGKGAQIVFTTTASSLGRLLVAATEKGLCAVNLGDDDDLLEKELRRDYPLAEIDQDDGQLGTSVKQVLGYLDGRKPHLDLPVDLRATAFQSQVWQRLRAIPAGETRSYGAIAADLGRPRAARAVGRACATNPVLLIVPCHRAVGRDGAITGYRSGNVRKRRLLAGEAARAKRKLDPA